jgi:hypothetical protein
MGRSDQAAARGGPGYGDGVIAFGVRRRRSHRVRRAAHRHGTLAAPVGSEVLAAPAIGARVIVLRSVDGRLRGFSVEDGRTLLDRRANLLP